VTPRYAPSRSSRVARLFGRIEGGALLGAIGLLSLSAWGADLPLPDLTWRLVGPFRAGWATVGAGIPDQPDTFFFGGAGGGIWKSTNAGRTWAPISDGAGIVSVGAMAIAASDPKIIYVGSGQTHPRYDIAAGDGMYRSSDGGATWQHLGLREVRHIGRIVVDPRNANIVTVAAMGALFGGSQHRGVYRSVDGGKSWTQPLFVDERTGVVDLAADPQRPSIMFAAAWQARDWPWLSYFQPIAGPGSGLYKSVDGGKTWKAHKGEGWPQGALGRITLAVTPYKRKARIYASIDGENVGGIWRSDDDGEHWQRVNEDANKLSGWYFARLLVAHDNPDVVYSGGRGLLRSTDAGKTFVEIKGAPGGDDYHDLWINPKHPERWITATDQGAVVSIDNGKTWSDWYNQPTGQFYHLAADNRFPYSLYSGQQDCGTVAVATRSDYGALSYRDWHPVGGDERDYDIPDPVDPKIVYGSGLGGRISRWDARTGQVANVSPWPIRTYGTRPTSVKYRYTWITPLAVSAKAPHALYVGNQFLWRSLDRGDRWEMISPDLAGARDPAKDCDGQVAVADATACGYGVIFSIAPSPHRNDEIWIGTDNGRVQLTRDGGKHWAEVTPKDLPAWSRINSIDVSPLDPGTAYVVADNHRQDDFQPYAWRTRDYGKTWQAIAANLPRDHFVAVLRADPVKRGLLYAGTDHAVHVSLDDGVHWQPLQQNLPHAWVRDLLVHGNDLAAATQGRAIWVLDDVTPLRQLAADLAQRPAHLFAPATALRVRHNNNVDTPLPPETPLARNPPAGAIIDYWLAGDATTPVKLSILDVAGKLVREFSSDDRPQRRTADRYFAEAWLKDPAPLPASAGMHRFVWDLRYPQPQASSYEYSIAAIFGENTPLLPQGPLVLPGEYTVMLKAAGQELRAPLTVKLDPRLRVSSTALLASLDFSRQAGRGLEEAFLAAGQLEAARKQLEGKAAAADWLARSDPLAKKKEGRESDFKTISEAIAALETDVEAVDAAPTAAQRLALTQYTAELRKSAALWATLREEATKQFGVRLPNADEIESRAEGSKERP
jgi:photosystem II stability/assembly factor-like uncharacterized protein